MAASGPLWAVLCPKGSQMVAIKARRKSSKWYVWIRGLPRLALMRSITDWWPILAPLGPLLVSHPWRTLVYTIAYVHAWSHLQTVPGLGLGRICQAPYVQTPKNVRILLSAPCRTGEAPPSTPPYRKGEGKALADGGARGGGHGVPTGIGSTMGRRASRRWCPRRQDGLRLRGARVRSRP